MLKFVTAFLDFNIRFVFSKIKTFDHWSVFLCMFDVTIDVATYIIQSEFKNMIAFLQQ